MSELIKTTLIGLFFGTFGTTLGGLIGIILKKPSQKFLSFILSFASGLMISVVCFDLIPESLELTKLTNVIIGIIMGIVCMISCDILVGKKFKANSGNSLLKTGIIVSIRLSLA